MQYREFFIYLLLLAGSTYLIRALPFVLVRHQVKNRYVRSFLAYIPSAVLTAMTVPAIFYATRSVISAAAGFLTALILALKGRSLTMVAACACLSVFVVELLLQF